MNDPEFARLICRDDGPRMISEEEYVYQMDRPNRGWCCPKCGDEADFDDDYYESHHGIYEEGDP